VVSPTAKCWRSQQTNGITAEMTERFRRHERRRLCRVQVPQKAYASPSFGAAPLRFCAGFFLDKKWLLWYNKWDNGNPTNYMGAALVWEKGRTLLQYQKNRTIRRFRHRGYC
jgi:hypothetical protein